MTTLSKQATPLFVYIGRILLTLSLIALLGAWLTALTGRPIMGLTQQHLFDDATVLALLGIGCFLDAVWHSRNL